MLQSFDTKISKLYFQFSKINQLYRFYLRVISIYKMLAWNCLNNDWLSFFVPSDKYLLAYHQDSFKVLMRGEIFLIVLMEFKHLQRCIIYIASKIETTKKQQLWHVVVSLIINFWASFHYLPHFLNKYRTKSSNSKILGENCLQNFIEYKLK